VIREIALSDKKIKKYIENKPLKKVIIIRKKQTLVNIVV
jgi:leucyl-tRNA synthetase